MEKAEFAAVLDGLLHRERLSVAQLAAKIGAGVSTVHSWLDPDNPKMPQGRNLMKLAQALNAPELAATEGAIREDVVDTLLAIMRRIVVGQSGPQAVEREGLPIAGELLELMQQATPALRDELNAAAGGDFEALVEPEQRRIVARLATEHRQAARSARGLPDPESR